MKYIARIIFQGGSEEIAKFNTPGKAIDYVTYWWESGYYVVYGEVIKCTQDGIDRRIWSMYI